MRIVNQPPRGIGKSTLELLRDRASQLGQPLWDVLYLDDLGNLPARSATALRKFRDLIVGLQQSAGDLPLPALLERLLEATAYTDLYKPDDPDDQARAREHPRVPLRRPGVHRGEQLQLGRAGPADRLPRPRGAGLGPRLAAVREGDLPDDPAQRQGAGVPGGGGGRPGGRPPPALQLPGRPRGHRGGAPPALRRHDPRPRAPVPHLLPPPPHRRPLPGPGGVALPGRAAGPAHRLLAERRTSTPPTASTSGRRGSTPSSAAAAAAGRRARRRCRRALPLRAPFPAAPPELRPPRGAAASAALRPRPGRPARRARSSAAAASATPRSDPAWSWSSKGTGTRPASPSSSRSRGSGSWWRSSPTWRCCSASLLFCGYTLLCKEALSMASSTLTSKGQITIPREVRDHLGLREGDRVVFQF